MPPELAAVGVLPVLDLGPGLLLGRRNLLGIHLGHGRLLVLVAQGLARLVAEELGQTLGMSLGASFLSLQLLAEGADWTLHLRLGGVLLVLLVHRLLSDHVLLVFDIL